MTTPVRLDFAVTAPKIMLPTTIFNLNTTLNFTQPPIDTLNSEP